MRRLLLALGFSTIAFSAMADASHPSDPDADFLASIDVGRFGVMLDQVAAARTLLAPGAKDAPAPSGETARQTQYRRLVSTVLRFNVLADGICADVALPAPDCAGPFMPTWLSAKPDERNDPVRLRAMIDEAGERIGNFWGDMCDKAKAASGNPHFCDIE